MQYNTSQTHLILKEYGRNIQKLVEYLKTIEDKEKRTQYAATLVELMKQIAPSVKETIDTNQRFWDDLYVMAKWDIDLDNPFPVPEKELLDRKPDKVPYIKNRIKYKHYGRNVELLVEEAIKKEDPKEREDAIIYLGKLMRSFYGTWNHEVIDDEVIIGNIRTMSEGKLEIDLAKVKEGNLFESLYKNVKKKPSNSRSGKNDNRKGGHRGNNNNRRRRN